MEYLRKTVDSKIFDGLLELPKSLKDRRVEIIILPFDDNATNNPSKEISADGIFKKYANPSLIPLEKEAWGFAVEDKYENR